MTNEEILTLLYRASEARLGVILQASDFQIARQRLYKVRRDAGDPPELRGLMIKQSPWPEEGNLIILNRRGEGAAA